MFSRQRYKIGPVLRSYRGLEIIYNKMKKKGPSKIAILLYFNVPKREKTVLKNSPQYISRCLNRDGLVGRTPRQNWRAVPINMVCGTGPSLWVRSAWAWAHTLQAWTSPRKTHYGKRVDVITNQANRRRGYFFSSLYSIAETGIGMQHPISVTIFWINFEKDRRVNTGKGLEVIKGL